MTAAETSNIDLLQALLSKHPDLMQKAKTMMTAIEDKQRKTVHITAKQYRTATVVYHCLHCGGTNSVEKKLETKSESFSYVGHDTNVYVVRYRDIESPVTVHSITRVCEECKKFISSLSREELEQRYINAISKDPVDMKHPPKKPVAKIEIEETEGEDA